MTAGTRLVRKPRQIRYPYKLGELVVAKLLALLHDPPWKSYRITKSMKHDELRRLARLVEIYADLSPARSINIDFGNKKGKKRSKYNGEAHEKDSSNLAKIILSPFRDAELINEKNGWNSALVRIAKKSDGVAASFDRIVAAFAENWFKFKQGGFRKYLSVAVVRGLSNIFDNRVEALSAFPANPCRRGVSAACVLKNVEHLVELLWSVASKQENGVGKALAYYHLFSLVYEPLWHEYTRGIFWGPADTRVPNHSVFDHLYASAMAVNITSHKIKGLGGLVNHVAGFFVYVGLRGVSEWIRSSRKLSDAWVSSWLATAMVWYAVKDLVWCLGPDILVVPGARWNQFYLSLLREKLGESFDELDKRLGVAKRYYFWQGFPYYAWQPSTAILVLPAAISNEDLVPGCSFLEKLYEKLYEKNKKKKEKNDEDTRDARSISVDQVPDKLQEVAKSIEEYLYKRLEEAWAKVVEAVASKARKNLGCLGEYIAKAVELAGKKPPMEPLVVVTPFWLGVSKEDSKDKHRVCLYIDGMSKAVCNTVPTDSEVLDESNVYPFVEELSCLLRLCCEDNLCYGLYKAARLLSKISGRNENAARALADVLSKFVYAIGFYRLLSRVEEAKLRPHRPGWAFLVEEYWDDLMALRGELAELGLADRVWRHCSVCRRGVAVLRVPGRDRPGGEVSEEFKEFARLLEGGSDHDAWMKWRPVFRPGERLCPYCLVKRLAGLPEFFQEVARGLIGYDPVREVRFPSTGDVAALATKLALLRLARVILYAETEASPGGDDFVKEAVALLRGRVGEILGDGVYECLVGAAARTRYRSDIHNWAAEKLGDVLVALRSQSGEQLKERLKEAPEVINELVEKRWWTPRLLYQEVLALKEAAQRLRSLGDEERDRERALRLAGLVLAVLLLSDLEFEAAVASRTSCGEEGEKPLLRVLQSLSRSLRRVARGHGGKGAILLRDIAEALARPRIYYSIIRFDVDNGGLLKSGLLGRPGAGRGEVKDLWDYLDELLEAHQRVYERSCKGGRRSHVCDKAWEGIEFLEKYLGKGGLGEQRCDPILWLAERAGSTLVTPSYHYAISNAVAYTLLRAAIVAERLGGIPVYMGGDEGLVFLPAWLPWSLLSPGARGYAEEVARAASIISPSVDSKEAWRVVAESPAIVYAVLLRRIYWASGARVPGFHPVKPRGSGGSIAYRIPAIVSNGLSAATRISHYHDHLYAELAVAENLLERAKRSGGDRLAMSMGRGSPALPHVLAEESSVLTPFTKPLGAESVEEIIRSAGSVQAVAAILAGLVDTGEASVSLLRGYELVVEGGGRALRRLDEIERRGHGEPGVLAARVAAYLAERYTEPRSRETVSKLLAGLASLGGWGLVEPVLRSSLAVYEAMNRSGKWV